MKFWDELAEVYLTENQIKQDDFHFGPLLPGNKKLNLLPPITKGLRCLEIGCGAGQNSLYLAQLGAQCVAVDSSEVMLGYGKKAADDQDIPVEWVCARMESLPELGTFDFIHSSYALPFTKEPASVVKHLASILETGGTMVISMGHPLHAGEFIELEEAERGLFLSDYFNLPSDLRYVDEETSCEAHYYPLSEMTDWLTDAGLSILRIAEPRPLENPKEAPYYSLSWEENVTALRQIPIVVIFVAKKMAP